MTAAAPFDWPAARCLLVAHCGSPDGHAALGPALRVLARWAGRGGGRLVGLWPGAPPPLARGVTDRDLTHASALDLDLGGETPCGAILLADPGLTVLDLGYALHLAGVPRRAGRASEFGGGVLTDPVTAETPSPEEGHLAVLAALKLCPPLRYELVHPKVLRPRTET